VTEIPRPHSILETILYADDLDAARDFYERVLGLTVYSQMPGRQIFFKIDTQMLLIFKPDATEIPPRAGALPVPPHGARGPGHVCFSATATEIDAWVLHLQANGVSMEADFLWPAKTPELRGRSIYLRDPAGNSLEFAEPRIWGFS
jgi:catechol 2,3-dioxygenase-like lactoylglutathione lyase family enzyme